MRPTTLLLPVVWREAKPLWSRTPSKGDGIVLGRSTWFMVLNSLFLHGFPTAIAAILVHMNIRRWYWTELNNHGREPGELDINTLKSTLQLVAKVHELLVVASLSSITIKVFSRCLIDSNLPLGLLSAPYRIGDVAYLFSPSFGATILSLKARSVLMAFLVALNTIMASLIGPACAILMVPELDWYPIPGAFDDLRAPIFYNMAPNMTWPRVVSNEAAPEDCRSELALYAYNCPRGGFSDIWKWIDGWEISTLDNPIELSEPVGLVRRRVYSHSPLDLEDGNATYTTTVSASSMLTIARLLEFEKQHYAGMLSGELKFMLQTSPYSPHTIYQPLVQTRCDVYNPHEFEDDTEAYFDYSAVKCFGDVDCEESKRQPPLRVPASVLDKTNVNPVIMLSAPNATETRPFLAAAALPYLFQDEEEIPGPEVRLWSFACVIAAHWAPSFLTIEPRTSNLLFSNISDPNKFFNDSDTFDPEAKVGPAIKILDSWVSLLDPENFDFGHNGSSQVDVGNSTTQSPLGLLSLIKAASENYFIDNKTQQVFNPVHYALDDSDYAAGKVSETLRTIIGVIIADALARTASHAGSYAVLDLYGGAVIVDNMGSMNGLTTDSFHFNLSGDEPSFYSNNVPTNGIALASNLPVITEEGFLDALAQGTTQFLFEAKRYGYGSGKRGPALNFAITIMSVYFLIVLVYLISVVYSSWRFHDSLSTTFAWGSIETLLLLVWNSTPKAPFGMREQIGDLKSLWRLSKQDAAIRADAEGSVRLHLLEKDDQETGLKKLVTDKKYL